MRAYVFLLASLSLICCVWGNNLILGRRLPGELILQNRTIIKVRYSFF